MSIINNLGQVILSQPVTGMNAGPMIFDITKAPPGTYWISIKTEGKKAVEKVLKQ